MPTTLHRPPGGSVQTEIGDALYTIARELLLAQGSLPIVMYGFKTKNGRVQGVAEINPNGIVKSEVPKLVKRFLKKYPWVAMMAESWAAPANMAGLPASAHADRKEIIAVYIYGKHTMFHAAHDIQRKPFELIKDELTEQQNPTGALMPGGVVRSKGNAKDKAKLLHKILMHSKPGWKAEAFSNIFSYQQAPDIKPLSDTIYNRDLPESAMLYANNLMEHLFTTFPYEDERGPHTAWLAGLQLRYQSKDSEHFILPEQVMDALGNILPSAAQDSGISFLVPPDCAAYSTSPMVAVSLLSNLVRQSIFWFSGHPMPVDAGSIAWLLQRNVKFDDELSQIRKDQPVEIVVFGAVYDLATDNNIDYPNYDIPPRWQQSLELSDIHYLQWIEATLSKNLNIDVKFTGLDPANVALRNMQLTRFRDKVNYTLRKLFDPYDASQLDAEIHTVRYTEPNVHEKLIVVVRSTDGKKLAPIVEQFMPWQGRKEFVDIVEQYLKEESVGVSYRSPQWIQSPSPPYDEVGGIMLPSADGTWFSGLLASYPEAKGVLQRITWKHADEKQAQDPELYKLPMPYRWERIGVIETVKHHYLPTVFDVIKQELSQFDTPYFLIIPRVCDRLPLFKALLEAHPSLALPDVIAWSTLRHLWSQSSTLVVTSSLSERLANTHLGDDMDASLIRLPFNVCYIHFEYSPEEIDASNEDANGESTVQLEGAFIEQHETDKGRVLMFNIMWTDMHSPLDAVCSEVELTITDENKPIAFYINKFFDDIGREEDDRIYEYEALQELLKVMVYMGLKDARMVESPLRTTVRQKIGNKHRNAKQHSHYLDRIKNVYDHIRVGPEHELRKLSVIDTTNGKKSPHYRRGFMNKYWVGPGRTKVVAKFIEPVIVNKHLLTSDNPIDPKDYDVT